jgi:hypothetical protein
VTLHFYRDVLFFLKEVYLRERERGHGKERVRSIFFDEEYAVYQSMELVNILKSNR